MTFDPILLISTDSRRRTSGLAFVYYFADLRYGYLEYIASDPGRPARGIGAALYEAMRELLAARGARGLFLDVPPTDPAKVGDTRRLAVNRKRPWRLPASCAFLTPIRHKNNILVLGPDGYRFGDYWRMGLPLEIVIVAVAAPLLLIAWPL